MLLRGRLQRAWCNVAFGVCCLASTICARKVNIPPLRTVYSTGPLEAPAQKHMCSYPGVCAQNSGYIQHTLRSISAMWRHFVVFVFVYFRLMRHSVCQLKQKIDRVYILYICIANLSVALLISFTNLIEAPNTKECSPFRPGSLRKSNHLEEVGRGKTETNIKINYHIATPGSCLTHNVFTRFSWKSTHLQIGNLAEIWNLHKFDPGVLDSWTNQRQI